MPGPFLSVVIPAYNEASCIDDTITAVVTELERLAVTWEILVVDDGSVDETAVIVNARHAGDSRVRLISEPHRGKGAAVRRGMLAATGDWRFLADADLSMPIQEIRKFLPVAGDPGADILIGSREAVGSKRLDEPAYRHALGRVFNWAVKLLIVRGIEDTQCGYKLFSADAARALFPHQRLDGFGFDVEVLFMARRARLTVREVAVTWKYCDRSKVTAFSGGAGFADLLRIRWNQIRGVYPPALRHRQLGDTPHAAQPRTRAGAGPLE